ncbi:PREDICTED: F-box protein SKIP23-like isoform X2 [Tarenaya hassleriana]|uniref:F-box protein SKIP23-like isoform X2 n=1 Tax=Tarenaya hassleriana TaxID=28532 RepID=UPI00053C7DA3|nr:PREDICTED: F-box protein SKIP23-like isoform X2 [Tarenaya hassleriana]
MVDWAFLPKDLLVLISKRLETSFDLIQFRSVCSSWRSAAEPKRHRPAHHLPILPDNGGGLFPDSAAGFRLSRRSIFLIGQREQHNETNPFAWLVKVEEDIDDPGRMVLVDPLSDRLNRLPDDFPRVLDLSRFRVRELGQEFKLHYFNCVGNIVDSLYLEKAVVKFLDSDAENEFVLLTIHVSGKLAVFKSWERSWAVIPDMPSPYDDVILFDDQFYAVDNNGRTVVVDFLSLNLTLAANPVFGGDKKFLVESRGELMLVDMYLSIEAVDGAPGFIEEFFEHLAYYMNERTVKFKVFKFDKREKGWVEVGGDLGDRMLFLGDDCNFSASASDVLPLRRESSVLFNGNVFNGEDYGTMQDRDVGVFEFRTGKIEPLRKRPELAKLFWPPPQWIASSMSENAEENLGETS